MQIRREPISTEFEGETHEGVLVIKGTRKLRFVVEYKGKWEGDGRVWGTDAEELHNMRVMAEVLLLRMVGSGG